MQKILAGAALAAAILFGPGGEFLAKAASAPLKNYEGVITQINLGDGSFTLRLRNGQIVTVRNPVSLDMFVRVKGFLNGSVIEQISELAVKDKTAKDALSEIAALTPGAAQIGDKIQITGAGFTKKNNFIALGDSKTLVAKVSSLDGRGLSFTLPSSLCALGSKTPCPKTVIPAGTYPLWVTNENGLSNEVRLTVLPLPPLAIKTDLIPQFMGGTYGRAIIEAIGGAESYVWKTDGALPPGLKFAQTPCKDSPCRSSFMISGSATVPGIYDFTISLTSGAENVSKQFSLKVVLPINELGH